MSSILQPEVIGRYLLFLYAVFCGISRAGSHIVIGMLFLTFIWYCLKYKEKVLEYFPKDSFKYFFIMALCLSISIIFSTDKLVSSKFLALFLYNQLVFFYTFCFIKNRKDILNLFFLIILSVGLNGIANVWQAANGVVRTSGFLPIMSTSALFGMTIPLIVILLLNAKKLFNEKTYYKYIIFLLVNLVFGLAGMFYNQTRISFLGIFCALSVYYIFESKFLSFAKKITVVFLISFLPILFLGSFFKTEKSALFNTSLKQDNRSNAMRVLMWEYGWDTFKEKPIFGFGIGALPAVEFVNKDDVISLEKTNSKKYGHIHNAYLQLLATTGIIGLFSYFLFWYKIVLKNIIMYLFEKNNNSVYNSIMLTTVVFFIVNNITDVLLTGLPLYFFSVLTSLCLLCSKEEL